MWFKLAETKECKREIATVALKLHPERINRQRFHLDHPLGLPDDMKRRPSINVSISYNFPLSYEL